MKLTKFEDSLHERLRDPDYAQSYLQAALRDGDKSEWLVAVREVAAATEGGVTSIAKTAKLGRESLYKSLSPNGNPQWETVRDVLEALGFELVVQRRDSAHQSDLAVAMRPSTATVKAQASSRTTGGKSGAGTTLRKGTDGTVVGRTRKHAKALPGKGDTSRENVKA